MGYYEITDKNELITKFNESYKKLQDKISGLSDQELDFIPFSDAWSIRELVSHIVDNEIECFARYRQAIAESGTNAYYFDIFKWKDNLMYSSQNIELTMSLFKILRMITAEHIIRIKDKDWSNYKINHPTRGEINLNMILSIYTHHVDDHLSDIDRNIREYGKINI